MVKINCNDTKKQKAQQNSSYADDAKLLQKLLHKFVTTAMKLT